MIVGVGIDIVEVARVETKVLKDDFKRKVFSANEIAYCERQNNKPEHFAVRFAAKEAFLKATGMGMQLGYDLHDIEVCHDEFGQPQLILHNQFNDYAKQQRWNKIHVSLTHSSASAAAVVIIEV